MNKHLLERLFESHLLVQRKVGRPKLTWVKLIEKNLNSVGINIDVYGDSPERTVEKLVELTEDRKNWRGIVRDIMTVNC